jgi:hypothetical protein
MKSIVLWIMMKNKQAIHGLRDEKLRKIRYELRTLLRLEHDAQIDKINERWRWISNNPKLSSKQALDQFNPLIREKEQLKETRRRYPINCIICGDRMRDLIYYPKYGWLCSLCKLDYESEA